MDLALVDSGVDVDENKYVPSCAGGVGADGSTVDDGGLATITNGDIVTGGSIVDTGEDALVDDVDGASVDIGILVDNVDGADGATVVDDADGVTVDDGILIPLLADDADGATVDGRILVDDTNGVSVDEGSVDGADGATVDKGIFVGEEEHEVLVLVPIGGGVVDASALASTAVPVGDGTC